MRLIAGLMNYMETNITQRKGYIKQQFITNTLRHCATQL